MSSLDLNKFFTETQRFASGLAEKIPLTSVILDDWRGGPRLIYGSPLVTNCKSNCTECPISQALNEDPATLPKNALITTLIPATEDDLKIFPAKQKFLNCKTLEDYLNCFVAWLIKKCHTKQQIEEEFDLVKNFRIVYLPGTDNLPKAEKQGRQRIIRQTLNQIDKEDPRRQMIAGQAKKLGLM